MNKSIVTKSSENSKTISPEQLQQIKNYYLNNAEWYAKRIVKYLQANSSLYPLWLNGNTTVDTIKPLTNTYYTGFFLGNTRKGNNSLSSLPVDSGETNCCD